MINELIQSRPKKEDSTTIVTIVTYKCIFHKNPYMYLAFIGWFA